MIKTRKEILSKYILQNIDILKIGHHESKTSSSKEFINVVNTKYLIIGEGKNNRYGHPNKEVLGDLKESKIYRMDKQGSNYYILDHFALKDKMVSIGSNTSRKIKDYKLSRYACYLIVQNCNPRIKIIALAQTYFAIQTRKQELNEKEYNELTEDEKRLYRRNQARKGNFNLNKTAVNSGVKDLARFHNAGYKGLYNGEIDAKLKRDNVDNEYTANSIHYEVGREIRDSIKKKRKNDVTM